MVFPSVTGDGAQEDRSEDADEARQAKEETDLNHKSLETDVFVGIFRRAGLDSFGRCGVAGMRSRSNGQGRARAIPGARLPSLM